MQGVLCKLVEQCVSLQGSSNAPARPVCMQITADHRISYALVRPRTSSATSQTIVSHTHNIRHRTTYTTSQTILSHTYNIPPCTTSPIVFHTCAGITHRTIHATPPDRLVTILQQKKLFAKISASYCFLVFGWRQMSFLLGKLLDIGGTSLLQ